MKTTIDKFGRVVVPKDMRERLGLKPGNEIEIEEQESRIVIKQVEERAPLIIEDGLLIFAGTATGDITESVRRHREERLSKVSSGKRA
jgi:AbrB family looped-hinge helix DNA binding protein